MAGVFDLELTEDGGRTEELSDEEYFEADESGRQQVSGGLCGRAWLGLLLLQLLHHLSLFSLPSSLGTQAFLVG